jgi:pSer/pThr/pTyr-binding forkhead associated (FHA) protein
MAAAFLVVRGETASGIAHPIAGSLTVGRGAGVDLSLPDPEVSRRHASVRVDGSTVVVEDLGSANGTRVNGTPIETATRVEDGGVIELGKTRLEVKVETGEAPTSTEDTPTEIHRP